jgi:hypothetical protein
MIRKTLPATKRATYSIDLPEERLQGLPRPCGTGFFVSGDGWFATAAHVLTENGLPDGKVRGDIPSARLSRPGRPGGPDGGGGCQRPELHFLDPGLDFALLKVDFSRNASKAQLVGLASFPHLTISNRALDDGEPVYAFGYPLSQASIVHSDPGFVVGHASHSPRTTSAIVAASVDETRMITTDLDPRVYVFDKALNYGNSGGPIVATETGRVHAWCSRIQPMQVPQPHLKDQNGNPLCILVPSLYGIVGSLATPELVRQLEARGIAVVSD